VKAEWLLGDLPQQLHHRLAFVVDRNYDGQHVDAHVEVLSAGLK
jgi:hypothetical protein